MAKSGKIRTLRVRPLHSADIGFNSGGIIDERNAVLARLGAQVTPFDFQNLIQSNIDLKQTNGNGRLLFDAAAIEAAIGQQHIYALRNDGIRATLSQAITQREMSWLQRYKHKKQILDVLNSVYTSTGAGTTKLERLSALAVRSLQRRTAIENAYLDEAKKNPQWSGVVRDSVSNTAILGRTISTTENTPVGAQNSGLSIAVRATPPSGNAGGNMDHSYSPSSVTPQIWNGQAYVPPTAGKLTYQAQQTTIDSSGVQQYSTSKGFEFRHPIDDNVLRDERNQTDLQDELLTQSLFAMRVPEMDRLLDAELEAIDLDIAKIQLRYAQTFLFAPIAGRVTAVYKEVGESAQPGEPVVRIESSDEILLVGAIQYRGVLDVDNNVQIVANDVFDDGDSLTLTGTLRSVRGHDANDEIGRAHV